MPLAKAPVENADLFPESLSLNAERHKAGTHESWNALTFVISNKSDQSLHASEPTGAMIPFGEMRPDRVRGRSQLTDEQMPCPVQSQAYLLLFRFDRHKTHAAPLHRLANPLGV
jgi:hypothetical protein